jgi:hypothetical protein
MKMSETKLSKIAVSMIADEALSKALEGINHGFDGGRVTKTDLASWFLIRGAEALQTDSIEEIRKAHFNQIAYLESLTKKMRSSGRESIDPSEVEILQDLVGVERGKKRTGLKKSVPAE